MLKPQSRLYYHTFSEHVTIDSNWYDSQNFLRLNFSNLYLPSMDIQQFYLTWKLQPWVFPWNYIINIQRQQKVQQHNLQVLFFKNCSICSVCCQTVNAWLSMILLGQAKLWLNVVLSLKSPNIRKISDNKYLKIRIN